MFTIGDFARIGRVSIRMLRHYDSIGLLRPARVDAASGYRFYTADQLPRLNRVIALKDLGFTLDQVSAILDEKIGVDELHGMLRMRRAQLEAQLAADTARLAGVEARLRTIETEGHMNTQDVLVKNIAEVRVAELSGTASTVTPTHIAPVLQSLYPELLQRLSAAGVQPSGPAIAYYDDAPEGSDEAVTVHAAIQVDAEPGGGPDFTVVDLPPIDTAATLIHRGSMNNVLSTLQTLAHWIEENGYRPVGEGLAREVYLDYSPDDADNGVTELQVIVTKA
jgi:DNA-binding transcriptional MerR regulator